MDRKNFIGLLTLSGGVSFASFGPILPKDFIIRKSPSAKHNGSRELNADLVVCGGGLGGCAAALAALRNGLTVIMTEETRWIGGQLTAQGVPPDEHQWIETHGSTKLYRSFRESVRNYYRRNYPLTAMASADRFLNPGNGSVSRLCHEPRTALAVLEEMLMPWISSGKLILLTNRRPVNAETSGNRVAALKVLNSVTGDSIVLIAPLFIDATELGDLLPLTGTEFVTGTESSDQTGELHAPAKPDPDNCQSFTVCFAIDHIEGEDHVIDRPADYNFWKEFIPELKPSWPGRLLSLSYSQPSTLASKELAFNPVNTDTSPLLNLWTYRRILDRNNFTPGAYRSDITLVNWPQNDYMRGSLTSGSRDDFDRHVRNAKQLSLSLLYWLQTEAPVAGGGYGWPGLRLRGDIMGSEDGLALFPYVRESRRIKALFTVLEEHVGKENRSLVTGAKQVAAADFHDSIGVGYYHIDLHPSSAGTNYIDFDSLPFQVPLGALIPVRTENLIPACKNIGTTHITNGCFRLHPVEWNIGESAGYLAAYSKSKGVIPRTVREKEALLSEFQDFIREQGVETKWPSS